MIDIDKLDRAKKILENIKGDLDTIQVEVDQLETIFEKDKDVSSEQKNIRNVPERRDS